VAQNWRKAVEIRADLRIACASVIVAWKGRKGERIIVSNSRMRGKRRSGALCSGGAGRSCVVGVGSLTLKLRTLDHIMRVAYPKQTQASIQVLDWAVSPPSYTAPLRIRKHRTSSATVQVIGEIR